MIPVSTPPMNDPPIIGAESFATCVAVLEKGFRVRLWQASTVADDSLTAWVLADQLKRLVLEHEDWIISDCQ